MRQVEEANPSILSAIGNTPVAWLDRLTRDLSLPGRIVAKLEHLQPGQSKKSRVARSMILAARRDGLLAPGQRVVEASSGNTGVGLAIVCAALGHPLTVFMSAGNTPERTATMRALGAEVVLVDQVGTSRPGRVSGQDIQAVEEAAYGYAAAEEALYVDQFGNPANADAHYEGTAPEFWRQTSGQLDAFVQFSGTGGAYAGCIRYFKEQNSVVAGYIVEPLGSEVLAGQPVTCAHHLIQGGGYGKPDLPLLKGVPVDGYLAVSDDEALEGMRMLACIEGVFAGPSSGANLAAAIKIVQGSIAPVTVGMIVCDSGLKYLSTGMFTSPNSSDADLAP
jgi:cysteine synthase A